METRLWFSYLKAIGYSTGLMMERLRAGKGYMVPTQTPMEFDRGWKPLRVSDIKRDKLSSELSEHERERAIYRASLIHPAIKKFLSTQSMQEAAE